MMAIPSKRMRVHPRVKSLGVAMVLYRHRARTVMTAILFWKHVLTVAGGVKFVDQIACMVNALIINASVSKALLEEIVIHAPVVEK